MTAYYTAKVLPLPARPRIEPEPYGDTWLTELIDLVDECLERARAEHGLSDVDAA
jgi:hypothetical protein